MSAQSAALRRRATLALTLACLLWGVSFPLMKTLNMRAMAREPGLSTWFIAATVLSFRFGLSAVALTVARVGLPNRAEALQGLGLGSFTAAGMILQMDALSFTEASTSAFLTQGYVFLLPFLTGFASKRLPSPRILVSAAVAVFGLGVLSRFDWQHFQLGRGEAETLLAALFFAFQILWLDKPHYSANRAGPVTLVMFSVMVVGFLVVAAASTQHASRDLDAVLGAPPTWLVLLLLTALCTLTTFGLMNRWQRHVSAEEAGIIYCVEPLFASLFALFIPSLLSRFVGVDYPNEALTLRWVVGGGLVLAANLLLKLPPLPWRRTAREPIDVRTVPPSPRDS